MSRSLSRRVRLAVLDRAGHRCEQCGEPRWVSGWLEVDHVRPVEDGGADDLDNLQALCARCHRRKTAAAAIAHGRRPRPPEGADAWAAAVAELGGHDA